MTKPTPGPWKLEHDGSLVIGGQVIVSPDSFKPDGASRDEGKANLRLAAAAPEMLEALKYAVENCPCSVKERLSGHRISCISPELEQVIAKAEARGE